MAVLGVQIVITLVVASVMSKVGPYLSLARWLLTSSSLTRYIHPSDEELRTVAKVPFHRDRGHNHHRRRKAADDAAAVASNDVFNVPRNIDVRLDTAGVSLTDLVQLRYYSEYQWLVDFAFHAVGVYALTEVYFYLLPSKALTEVNLSMVWCTLSVGFAYKLLISMVGLYFEGGDTSTGERSLVIIMGFVYLLLAMLILVVQEDTLETGLDDAYLSFNNSAATFLAENAGLDSSGPASKLVLKFCLAVWCGSIGALFTFPGLRLARMQWDSLRYTDNGPLTVLLHAAFISPLILTTLWVKPLSRDYLTEKIYKGMDAPLLTPGQFETLRLYAVILVIVFRIVMMRTYLQSYLNMAFHKMEEMKQEAGKISNVDLQKSIARVFYYLCVVTLQYVAPMILILHLTLMYKTMGGGSWDCSTALNVNASASEANESDSSFEDVILQSKLSSNSEDVDEAVQILTSKFSLAWQSLKHVFTTAVFRGLLGFSTWWCCLTWFTSAAIGISYQSYFTNV